MSDVPEFGGVKADSGSLGRFLGPLRRRPTPGEGGIGGKAVAMVNRKARKLEG